MNAISLAQQIINGPHLPLSKADSITLWTGMTAAPRINSDPQCESLMQNDPLFQIMRARAQAVNVELPCNATLLTLAALEQIKTPGRVMLYICVFKHMAQHGQPLTLHGLCLTFPDGFPSEENMSAAWSAQKAESDGHRLNQIDTPEFWQ